MVFSRVMEQFIGEAPLSVMTRMALQSICAPRKLDELFERTAQRQYTYELLFSQVVELMSLVVCRASPSVHAAYQRNQEAIGVSVAALYAKLNHLEGEISRELVRHTAREAKALIGQFVQAPSQPLLPGYRIKCLDGNHLGSTHHRLEVLRSVGGGALPGLSVVVMDPETMVIEDVVCCEDGHAQECTLLEPVLEAASAYQVFVGDRHYCTSEFLFGLDEREAFFVIRQHLGHLRWEKRGRRRRVGTVETGVVYEQSVGLTHPQTGQELEVRRMTLRLHKPTRNGDRQVHILTNLPAADIRAAQVAELYRTRWTLETAFQQLMVHLKCELQTLGDPAAALFGSCVAVASDNLLAVVIAALKAAQGAEAVEECQSHDFVAEELSGVYRGMMIALPPATWAEFETMTTAQLAKALQRIARGVDLSPYRKHPRGPKKPKRARPKSPRKHHATAQLLEQQATHKSQQSNPP